MRPNKTPADLPRREFPDAATMLAYAQDLLTVGRWYWRPMHQTGHDVEEMEAVQFLRFARLGNVGLWVEKDPWDGRWRVEGRSPFAARRIRVNISVWMRADGDWVYFASAYARGKAFGH